MAAIEALMDDEEEEEEGDGWAMNEDSAKEYLCVEHT